MKVNIIIGVGKCIIINMMCKYYIMNKWKQLANNLYKTQPLCRMYW